MTEADSIKVDSIHQECETAVETLHKEISIDDALLIEIGHILNREPNASTAEQFITLCNQRVEQSIKIADAFRQEKETAIAAARQATALTQETNAILKELLAAKETIIKAQKETIDLQTAFVARLESKNKFSVNVPFWAQSSSSGPTRRFWCRTGDDPSLPLHPDHPNYTDE